MNDPIRCPDCGEIAEYQGDGEYVCEVCAFSFTDEDIEEEEPSE